MRLRVIYIIYFLPLATPIAACKKPYNPPATSTPNTYIVVEGLVNSGGDSTIIKVSHTVKLTAETSTAPEPNAQLVVEGDNNVTYTLKEQSSGTYVYPGLNLDVNHKYRLKVNTSAGKQYASDFVPVINSPLVDSITYKVESDGLSINVNTHSPNNIRYYRWDYNETWIHTSDFESSFKSNGDTVLQRDPINDEIYTCWRTNASSTITLGSSAKLAQDVISDFPITFISRHSDKITHRYSILVKQYGLTKDAYEFWRNLKTNTEQLGSIFDAQPSQINGNMHSLTDANEVVIGYVSIGSYASKRIYIDERVLPNWIDPPNDGCSLFGFLYNKGYDRQKNGPANQVDWHINYHKSSYEIEIPVAAIKPPGQPILGYTAAPPACVDCTLVGTNKKPDFWQ